MNTYQRMVYFIGVLFFSVNAKAGLIQLASDQSWNVLDTSNNSVGAAQAVCISASAPASCPAGAVQYNATGSGWAADLSSIPGAQWIWAPGITGSTANAELDAYIFQKSFVIDQTVSSATLSIAVDDYATVTVNGTLVGSTGSTIDLASASWAQNNLKSFDISAFLTVGTNVIEVMGRNGIDDFAGCTACTYAQNPAGVVFGGTITTVPVPASIWLFFSGVIGLLGLSRRRISD